MRQLMLGFCILAAACSSEPGSATTPSAVPDAAATQTQAKGGAGNIEVTFTKWIDQAFPKFIGVAGAGRPGTFAATVLDRTENGNVVKLEARYEVIDDGAGHSFVALLAGTQNNQTQKAVLNGTIIEGSLVGARVHVTFDVIRPCPEFDKPVCFTGVVRVMSGSAK
jgi:hypothetical protein